VQDANGSRSGEINSASVDSFKRLPKKRKFDLSDFETPEPPKVPNVGSGPTTQSCLSSTEQEASTSAINTSSSPFTNASGIIISNLSSSSSASSSPAPRPPSASQITGERRPSYEVLQSHHQHNHSNHLSSINRIEQIHYVPSTSPGAQQQQISHTQHNNFVGIVGLNKVSNIHAPVIVTSSSHLPLQNSVSQSQQQQQHHVVPLSIPESQGLASKALINPQLDTHISLSVLKSPGGGGGSAYSSPYGRPTGGNLHSSYSPQQHHQHTPPPPTSVYSGVYHQQTQQQQLQQQQSHHHHHQLAQSSEQPIDLGCRSNPSSRPPSQGSSIDRIHSGGPPGVSGSSVIEGHYSNAITPQHQQHQHQQHQQQSITPNIVTYRSRSPSPYNNSVTNNSSSSKMISKHNIINDPVQSFNIHHGPHNAPALQQQQQRQMLSHSQQQQLNSSSSSSNSNHNHQSQQQQQYSSYRNNLPPPAKVIIIIII